MLTKQHSEKTVGSNSPPRKTATKRSCVLRAALPHGMPLVRNLFAFSEYIPEVCRRLVSTSSGDIIVVSGFNDLSGAGKTSVLAGVVQQEEVQTLFCAMFWMNLGAYADDADLSGATKVLAIDVYFTLRNLVESLGADTEAEAVMNRCGKILGDLETLESAENVLREIISATKKCLSRRGYGSYCPLLILDDLWNQRLLLLLRETGFTILVSTRYDSVLDEDQFAGCCYVLDPLPAESCLRLFYSLSPVDRPSFEKLPSSRDLVRLCSKFVTPLELAVLAGITQHWDPAALPLKIPAMLKKREKIMNSPDKMAWIQKYWEEHPKIFTDNLAQHKGLMSTMLLSVEMLDELAVKCYLSMVTIPSGAVFDFEYLRILWDFDDEIVKAVLDLLVSRHLVVPVVESPQVSSRERSDAVQSPPSPKVTSSPTDELSTGSDTDTKTTAASGSTARSASPANAPDDDAPIPHVLSFEDSIYVPSKLEGLYQIHGLQSDFLMLCALNFSAVANRSTLSGFSSVLSFFESEGEAWRRRTFAAETNCIIAIQQSCDRVAGYLASKELLVNTDQSRLFLYSGYWRRLEILNKLGVWLGLERTYPKHPCIIPYLQQRMDTEKQLEGVTGSLPFMKKACMMLELVNSRHHDNILEEWYREMLGCYGTARAESDLLEQARVLNCLGELLLRRGQPAEALDYHRKALLIYPQFVNEATAAGDAGSTKRIAERGMLAAMENVAMAITLIPRGHPNYDPQALAEAAETQRLVVRMKLNIYGTQHVGLATSVARLAEILCAEGRYTEAIVEHEKALKLFALKLGTNHPLYQASKGEYGISLYHVVDGGEENRAKAVETIQEAVVWLLHHGVSWDDKRIERLKKYLPPENIEYLTDSIVGVHYIRRVGNIFPFCGIESTRHTLPMCGLESLISHTRSCAPVYDVSLHTSTGSTQER